VVVWCWCGVGVVLVWCWCGVGVVLVWCWCGGGVVVVRLWWCGFGGGGGSGGGVVGLCGGACWCGGVAVWRSGGAVVWWWLGWVVTLLLWAKSERYPGTFSRFGSVTLGFLVGVGVFGLYLDGKWIGWLRVVGT